MLVALRLSLVSSLPRRRHLPRPRGPARLAAGAGRRSAAATWCAPSSCCRWCCRRWSGACTAPRLRPQRTRGAGSTTSSASAPVLDGGRRHRRDVRRDAVPRHHRRGGPALHGPPLRGRGRHPRARAAGPCSAGSRCRSSRRRWSPARPWLGPRARRVRRDHHVRRQPAGHDPDDAAGRVRRARDSRRSAIALSLVLLAVSLAVWSPCASRWLGIAMTGARRRVDGRAGRAGPRRRARGRRAEVVALLGPNGAGKTTLLRALAGLGRSTHGRIVLDGTVVDDPAPASSCPGAPARRRRVPGLPALPAPDRARQRRLRAALARGVRAVARAARTRGSPASASAVRARKPGALSGGPGTAGALRARARHRAAPAAARRAARRARRRRPRGAAPEPRPAPRDVRRRLPGDHPRPHRRDDARRSARRARGGPFVQAGPAEELATQPRSPYVAELVGVNLYAVGSTRPAIVLAGGRRRSSPPGARDRRRVRRHPAARGRPAPGHAARGLAPQRVARRVEDSTSRYPRARARHRPAADRRRGHPGCGRLGGSPTAVRCISSVKAIEVEVYEA